MSDVLVGFAIMASRPGEDWGRRTTFTIEQRGKSFDAAVERTKREATHGMQQWQHLEPHTRFCIRELVAGSWGHRELFQSLPA